MNLLSAAIFFMIVSTILAVAAAVFFLVKWATAIYSLPIFTLFLSIPVGLALGVLFTFTVVFNDLGRTYRAKFFPYSISVSLHEKTKGYLHIFFDPNEPPLTFDSNRETRLTMPESGILTVGSFPEIEYRLSFVKFSLAYPQGVTPKLAELYSKKGSSNGVHYYSFYIGSQHEYEASLKKDGELGIYYDPMSLFRSVRK